MSQKHLHELLREDQEPFHLNNYIADRRSQLKSTSTTTTTTSDAGLKLTKRKPIIRNLCFNHACMFALQDSPDVRNSPFTDFPLPATKSPCNISRNLANSAGFLHDAPKTSSMLLDAAMKVHKQSFSNNVGFGLLGSFLKLFKQKNTITKRREIDSINGKLSDKVGGIDIVYGSDEHCRSYGNNSRLSNSDWSEKSSESETSCSSISVHESYGIERQNHEFSSPDKCFRSSPSSPFRFSLLRSPSPGRQTPDFLSPAASPSRCFRQEKESYDVDHTQEIHGEDEEQFSPVSILDPPFVDDEHEDGVAERVEYDPECTYASIQRSKHQILRRFENFVELDPIVLEKRIVEEYNDAKDDDREDLIPNVEKEDVTDGQFLQDILNNLEIDNIPWHIKRLVLDLVAEEKKMEEHEEREVVVKRVIRRLDSWKTVNSNTIDMMVEFEMRREKGGGWKSYDEEKMMEIGMNVEVEILEFLIGELVQELVISFGYF